MPKALTFFRKSGHKFIISAANLKRNGRTYFILFYKLCHNTKKTLQIVTGNHNSFWPITVIPK